jgi:predicted CxxxxCH...CXXCH cytochrome family protein
MPQATRLGISALLAVSVMILAAGCGDPKNDAFNPDTGKHKAEWLPEQHSIAASSGTTSLGALIPSTESCTECHGADLSGGISNVSCTTCHLGGPTAIHPSVWDPIYLTHGPSVSTGVTTIASCANQYCHGTNLAGVVNSGPSCSSCHSWPYDPTTVTCGACHRIPPDGTKFPNLAGKHGKHATSNTSSCDICHNGASSYVGDHHNNVINFSFLAAYTPKTLLTPTFNATAKTCSNISCHGGQITPSWYTGSIDVNAQCSSCHQSGTTQYNSYNSGEHSNHMGMSGVVCTYCHDTTKLLAVHFNDLNTPAMTQANQTILDALNYNGSSCLFTCHIRNEQHDRGMNW